IRDFHVTGVQTCALPILFPAKPLAKTNTESFVDVSPSTVIQLNVKSVICDNAYCNTSDSIFASVVINASIVAIFGSIIPEPFARSEERRVGNSVRHGD